MKIPNYNNKHIPNFIQNSEFKNTQITSFFSNKINDILNGNLDILTKLPNFCISSFIQSMCFRNKENNNYHFENLKSLFDNFSKSQVMEELKKKLQSLSTPQEKENFIELYDFL